jgi:hypothetical protein
MAQFVRDYGAISNIAILVIKLFRIKDDDGFYDSLFLLRWQIALWRIICDIEFFGGFMGWKCVVLCFFWEVRDLWKEI